MKVQMINKMQSCMARPKHGSYGLIIRIIVLQFLYVVILLVKNPSRLCCLKILYGFVHSLQTLMWITSSFFHFSQQKRNWFSQNVSEG
jgi:hypothetical protein